MKHFILAGFCSLAALHLNAQTYTGTGGAIPDDGTSHVDFIINVSGLSPSTIDTNFGLKQVCLNITHTYNSDIEIRLIAPDGTNVALSLNNGGDSDNYSNTCFDQQVPTSILSGWGPFIGTYRPQGNLGNVNNGQNGNGNWILRIFDNYPTDAGALSGWALDFGTNAAGPSALFTSSNLPIVVINTSGQTILDDPKITVDMGILYNGVGIRNYMTDAYQYTGKIGIEIRGSSSSSFPKKTFGFETRDVLGNNLDTPLINLPKEHDWILSASYTDKSLMNNMLAYKLSRDFGYYAPRTEYVELIIDGVYQGVYILMEKIKRDKNRVDIAKLTTTDTSDVELTGGYIFKIDKFTGSGGAGWTSPYAPAVSGSGQTIYYQYEYPDPLVIMPQQKTYIQNFVDSFETALATLPLTDMVNGWRAYADEWSFIHYFILNEISKNVDGYRLSTYLYKTKSTAYDNIVIGPPWDYDLGFKNANYCSGSNSAGWAYQFGDVCGGDYFQVPFWWDQFMLDNSFKNNLKCKYTELRATVLDTANLFDFIDSTSNYLNEGQTRNFETWPILGSYIWPNPTPLPVTYQGEIDELKQWFIDRFAWLDANMPGTCTNLNVAGIEPLTKELTVFPNPTNGIFNFSFVNDKDENAHWIIINNLGEVVLSQKIKIAPGKNTFTINEPLASGSYCFVLRTESGSWNKTLIKQ